VRGPGTVKIDLIRLATTPLNPCDTDEAIVNHARRRRVVLGVRSRYEEPASRQSMVESRRRAIPWATRRHEERASRRSKAGPRLEGNARIVQWWTSVTGRARWRYGFRTYVPRRCARWRFAVPVWQRDRRDRKRIESLPRLFLGPERVALRLSRHGRPPREAVRGAFDEGEESMRPRSSLPVAFRALFRRHR
jgi:hypothetical protein